MKSDISIGEIVALDYRAASVCKEAGIDFCCGGGKSLNEAYSEKESDPAELVEKLNRIEFSPNTATHNLNE
jgi:regulator of cell morphogenesis and NO signaling